MLTYIRKLPRIAKICVSPNPNLGDSQLDHVPKTKTNIKEVLSVKVIKNCDIDSDHYISEIKLQFLPSGQKRNTSKYPATTSNE